MDPGSSSKMIKKKKIYLIFLSAFVEEEKNEVVDFCKGDLDPCSFEFEL